MKYIDTDKLIAEIERRIAAYQKNFDKADNKIAKLSTDGRIASLKGILSFITSLQQEQPEVDIDEEIDKFMFAPFQNFKRVSKHCLVDMGDGKEWVPVYDWKITYKRADAHFLREFALHFYNLGLKARKEES